MEENVVNDYFVERFERLLRDIVNCCQNRELFQAVKFRLPRAELQTLLLFEGERYLTVKQISQKLEVTKSRVTVLVENLEKRGLVDKLSDPQDARVKLVTLTRHGKSELERIRAFRRDLYRRILDKIGEENRRSLLAHLDSLKSAMEEVKAEVWGIKP